MKNKKGFTLVELIAVIALIAILIMLIIVSVTSITKTVMEKQQEKQIESIKAAAVLYAQHEKTNDGKTIASTLSGTSITITVNDLLSYGYLTPTITYDENDTSKCAYSNGCIIDPVTKVTINSCVVTISKNAAGKTVVNYNESCVSNNE